MSPLENYLTDKELAGLLKKRIGCINERTLRKWRERRIGPPWVKFNRIILYPSDGIEPWLRSQVQQPVRSRRAA